MRKLNGLRLLIAVISALVMVLVIALQVVSAQTWASMEPAPGSVHWGGALAYVPTVGDSGFIYALRGDGKKDFWRYDINTDTWDITLSQTPANVKAGGALAYDGGNYIYALRGDGTKDFWRYEIGAGTWSTLSQTPLNVKEGGALVYAGGSVYALRGDGKKDFWRYDISTDTWDTTLSQTPLNVKAGGALAYDGGNYIYALRGDGKKDFWRYDIGADTWSTLSQTPFNVKAGGALAYDGSDYIYALRGDDTTSFWRYSITGATWETMASTPDKVREGGALVYADGYVYAFQGKDKTAFWRYSAAELPPPAPDPNAPPVDGRIELDKYTFVKHFEKSGTGSEALAPGALFMYAGTNTCYYAFEVSRAFNDNVYDDHDGSDYLALDGWRRHTYSNLLNSDQATFDVSAPGNPNSLYFNDLTVDYLIVGGNKACPDLPLYGGNWSSGLTGGEGSVLCGTSQARGVEAATSLEWNLEQSGWSDLTKSPPYDWAGIWEWHMIYEFSIPRSEMGGGCGDVYLASSHNSPSKDNVDKARLGDYVWLDADNDGLQDAGEGGIAGVTVKLYSGATLVRQTQTGAAGDYIFNNLEPGDYRVQFVLPASAFTVYDAGDDSSDSDADPAEYGKTIAIHLDPGETDPTWDAGIVLGSIGDRVWWDESGLGDQNENLGVPEPGFNGVEVLLFQDDGDGVFEPGSLSDDGSFLYATTTIAGTSKDPDGYPDGIYGFDMNGPGPGYYWVWVNETTLPAGTWVSTTGGDYQLVHYLGGDDFSIDFGYEDAGGSVSSGKIGDRVWYDENGDGDQTSGVWDIEGFNGVDVYLYDSSPATCGQDGYLDMQTTASGTSRTPDGFPNGIYKFDMALPGAGTYWVCVDVNTLPPATYGWKLTTTTKGNPQQVVYNGSTDDFSVDFGFEPQGPPTAVTVSFFAAKSTAGGVVSPLWLGFIGLTVLAAGSLFWAKRRAG